MCVDNRRTGAVNVQLFEIVRGFACNLESFRNNDLPF